MKLSVVIVNYNVKYYVEQCLKSLQRSLSTVDAEVFVMDNHSRDGSVDYLASRFPWVKLVRLNHNLGFAKANNKAIMMSHGEYVLLLNPDTLLSEALIPSVLSFMDAHSRVGASGVWMMDASGESAKESRRGVPTPMTSFYKLSGLCSCFPHHPRIGRYYMCGHSWDQAEQIEIVSGAFCMLRRKALEDVGLLDEDFFMYGEDIDLSYRILKAGWENWYLPCKMLHYKGESTEKSSFRYVHVFYEAMLIFYRKHYRHFNVLISIPVQTAIYMKALHALIGMQLHKMRKSLGFVSKSSRRDPLYVVFASASSRSVCEDVITFNGLNAELHVVSQWNEVLNIASEVLQRHLPQPYMVFDTTLFSYQKIFDLLNSHPRQSLVGWLDPDARLIITPKDVFTSESAHK